MLSFLCRLKTSQLFENVVFLICWQLFGVFRQLAVERLGEKLQGEKIKTIQALRGVYVANIELN